MYFVVIWYILWPFALFYVHLVYFMVIQYIFPILVCCTMKNLATLGQTDTVLKGCLLVIAGESWGRLPGKHVGTLLPGYVGT
jgi:hypothetical protein